MDNATFLSLFRHLREEQYDDAIRMKWFQKYSWVSALICCVYVYLVYRGRRWMESKPKLSLRIPLTLWSLSLALFSARGAYVMSTYVFTSLYRNGLQGTLCSDNFYDGISGYWVCVFSLSKAAELLDTCFIILRKQKLAFLHWYHHALTLFYASYGYRNRNNSPGQFNVMLNFMVHTVMYSYYAVRATGMVNVPKRVNVFITSLQILQMASALLLLLLAISYVDDGIPCALDRDIYYLTLVMYISYLLLFLHFFYRSYFVPQKNEMKKQ